MAISGLALTFPLMNLAAAFGSLVGVGAATLVSVKLGQKDYDTAQRVLGNVLVLNIIIGLAFTVVTLIFLDPILYFFGGSDATVGYARDYMVVILLGNVVTHLYLGLNAVLRSAGHPQKAMVATIATVVINTILDPVFIYGFGWGIQGAAIATITAQVIALAWQFKLFSNKEELLHFHKGIFRLKKKIVVDSLAIGMAPFLMNLAACFIVILINQGLQHHGGDLAIGAFGIVNRLVFLFVMIVMGLNQGMQPIAGYNYGAKQYPRVTKVLKITIYAATIVTTTGFLMGIFIPRLAVSIFTTHEELVRISAKGLRIVVMFFPIVGFQNGDFQLLPEYRHGEQGDIFVCLPPGSYPDTLSADSSTVLRTTGSLDKYADFRSYSKLDCRDNALVAVQAIQESVCLTGLLRYSLGEMPTYTLHS